MMQLITPESLEDVDFAFASGLKRAKAANKSILVSFVTPVSATADPITVFDSIDKEKGRWFWGNPDEEFWLVGSGSCSTLPTDGQLSLEGTLAEQSDLFIDALIEKPDVKGVGPVMMGGMRYDPSTIKDEMWQRFPDTLFVLPRILFTWSNGQIWLTFNELVHPSLTQAPSAGLSLNSALSVFPGGDSVSEQPRILYEIEGTEDQWNTGVDRILHLIDNNEVSKIVLARKKILHAGEPFSVTLAISRLSKAYPECSVFGFQQFEDSFIGATPEQLVKVESGTLNVSCLAGTAPRGSNPIEDQEIRDQLLNSPKERGEHSVVVKMISETLSEFCDNLQWPDQPEIVQLKDIQHLSTTFESKLSASSHILKVLDKLHPTPAVAGTPTDKALRVISQLEGDRGWYAAPVGWFDSFGDGEFRIAIRSALISYDKAVLFAGCGIVAGSNASSEFQEAVLKLQPLTSALRSGDAII